MSRLNKNPAGADWVKEPIVPDPMNPVKAWANPGAVKPAYQTLSDRIWSIASGAHSIQQLYVDGFGQRPSPAPFPANLVALMEGGLEVRNGAAPQMIVQLNTDGVTVVQQGRWCMHAPYGLAWNAPAFHSPTEDASYRLYIEQRPVAVAIIQLAAPGPSGTIKAGSIGIKRITFSPAQNPTWIVVELAGRMASAVYAVQATCQLGVGDDPALVQSETFVMQVSRRTATEFYLQPPTGATAVHAITAGELVITVFGRPA